jgi:cyanophycinase
MHQAFDRPNRTWHLTVLLALLLLIAGAGAPATAAPRPTRTLVPIGSGYTSATLQRFAQAAAQHDTSGNVYLLVLPITFATDPFSISNGERNTNLTLADTRRGQVETACNTVKAPQQTCHAVLAPILVRGDAYLPSNLELFTPDLDGIYILGGDQTIAMQVVADTPTEQRMAAAYNAGVVVGGNSAGAAVESLNMIGGYTGNNGPENGLQQGSVDLWLGQTAGHRGLIFGLPNALLDQHVLQRGRIGRLINAVWTTKLLGIGADANTAAPIVDERTLPDVVGDSAAFVVDIKTYGSRGRYAGPTNSLAISRVATHVIPSGGYGYDLVSRQPLVNNQPRPAPDVTGRTFGALVLSAGYGPLLLGGDISSDKSGPAAQRFVSRSGGVDAHLVVLATGYAKAEDARATAKAYAQAFQGMVSAPVQSFVLDARADQSAIQDAIAHATGVFLTAPDQSLVWAALDAAPEIVSNIRARWQGGMPLMADNAAAAALGQVMTSDPPPPSDTGGLEDASVKSFRPDDVTVAPGLAWVPGAAFEPRLLPDRHWGRLYNILYDNHDVLGIGIDVGTAVELTQAGATVVGTSAAVTLDGRYAAYSLGSNGALGAIYVILDSFVAGDKIVP